jgi:23S rRNA (uracil1939-C5)-methyltransferase
VEDAKENALRNGITNAEFICGDAGEAALELERRGVKADVVVVDPPRKGLNADAIEALARFGTKRIVYVSCDPATLGRDVALLKEKGYRLSSVTAADLFPRCAHVETVITLSRKMPDDIIEIDLDLGELDLTAAEAKATYPEIKEYVLKHHGLKVSSLYIAQVKRKCGLDVGANYNLPSPEGRPQLQVPPEKETAILDALKHFAMI